MAGSTLHREVQGICRQQVYVWELPVRLFHWINAISITVLFVTGFYIGDPFNWGLGEATRNFLMGTMRYWHGLFAFIFTANLLVRLYWFWPGNEYSKMKLWRRSFWKDALATFKYYSFITREHTVYLGHNALAQLMYFFFVWVAGGFMILTGFAMRGGSNPEGIWQKLLGWLAPAFRGEYQIRNLHHLFAWGFAVFLLGHLYMVLRQDLLDDDGTVSSIINGYKFELVVAESPSLQEQPEESTQGSTQESPENHLTKE
ncbi:Ni/Fe-hydrogenase, b-type cytochrome subunit [Desulfitobacterium sp.]|uniref:Ni/Fe-hydrogenase, b-type cytochrome subunit n=1 Tax=Desulfitobacterium sp. TaxID=49981 RepID=UPI002D05EF7E|nr:Ni/Fe-hydrogenase, b-type cytochrome subunit [Desulfitobacterium sp.]HVJ48083.1 Ni/Fe-hydrogenase, b-type cytochrome subunit [Desulfitobacterium sp.]